jgi:CBS domain-containing protein
VLTVSAAERKILLSVGAAAGMAATFGTPLAAVILAIELLLFEYSTRALVPLLVGTSVAAGVHAAIFGAGPLFEAPAHEYFGLANLPAFAALGVACGFLAVVICKGLFVVEAAFRRLPIPVFWHPVIGGLGFAIVGLFVPGVLGVGYDEIGDVLLGRLALGTIAVLLVGKLVAWWIALGSGTSGGTLAPILLMAGCFGSLFAAAVDHVAPGLHPSGPAFALVAMAATFAAATRTPLTSIVFVFELTRDYQSVLPLMGATVLALLIARWLMSDSLMTEKLTRRGVRVHGDYEVDRTKTVLVRDVMTDALVAIGSGDSVGEAKQRIGSQTHSVYPIVGTSGRCLGVVDRHTLVSARRDEAVARLASPPPPADGGPGALGCIAATSDETLHGLVMRLVATSCERAIVVDGGQVVGICTRTDVLKPRAAQLDHERRADGWFRSAHDRATPTSVTV